MLALPGPHRLLRVNMLSGSGPQLQLLMPGPALLLRGSVSMLLGLPHRLLLIPVALRLRPGPLMRGTLFLPTLLPSHLALLLHLQLLLLLLLQLPNFLAYFLWVQFNVR